MREVVLVASGGGHVQQLRLLADRLPYTGHRRWITFDTPQTRSLLGGEDVNYVPYVGPRDYKNLFRNTLMSPKIGVDKKTEAMISTGSGVALAYLPPSGLRGVPTHYIESATRVMGPSLTGRLLERCPGVRVHTQYESWANSRWGFAGSVFEGFEAVPRTLNKPSHEVRKIVVSLGTIRPYGFRRLIERLVDMFNDDVEVTWQTGSTNVDDLPIKAESMIPDHELRARIADADLLVAHAGTGIALTGLSAGVCPLLVPREAAHGEHVDDHQFQIAKLLDDSGLAVSRTVDDLSCDDLLLATSRSVVKGSQARELAIA